MLGDSALLAVGGVGGKSAGGLKSQGTVTSAKQMRIDQKKLVPMYFTIVQFKQTP